MKNEEIAKEQDINSFTWKWEKELDSNGEYKQKECKMVDMTEEELRAAYNQCKTMLYNKDQDKTGRYLVLESIYDQRDEVS